MGNNNECIMENNNTNIDVPKERRRDWLDEEMHHQQHEFLSILIEREKQKIAFRKAVIEKTMSSLIWSGFVGLGVLLWTGFKDHIK